MKCCKTCKHFKVIGNRFGADWEVCYRNSELSEPSRISGKQQKSYEFVNKVLDVCDREGYYEPNLIQRFKNLFTGE